MITHRRDPGPVGVWNPQHQCFDDFDDFCMTCGSNKPHHSRFWVIWQHVSQRKRLIALRIGMDLTAHEAFRERMPLPHDHRD